MKRKIVSIVLCAALMGSVLAGCGSTQTESGSTASNAENDTKATEAASQASSAAQTSTAASAAASQTAGKADGAKVHLKWAMWDATFPYWQDLANGYMAANPNVEIEMVDFGSSDYDNVLATELSGEGTDFDIVTIKDVPSYATLIDKKAIVPLNDYIKNDNVDLTKFNGATDQITTDDGSLYELPFRSDIWVIYYNKDIFDKAGVAYPTNDMTWDEYDKLARSVTKTDFGSEVYGAHYHTWNSCVQFLGNLDGKHSILDKNYDYMLPFYKMVLKEEADGVCQKYSDLKTEELHYSAAFANGNVAMMNQGTWFITTLLAKLKSGEFDKSLCGNWGMVKYPHAEGVEAGTTLGTVTGMSVVAASDQQEAAFNFINWASGEEGAKILAASGTFPAILNDDITGQIAGLEGFPTDDASKEALKTVKIYLEAPYGKDLTDIQTILGTYHDMIMTGEMTPEDGIKAMNEEAAKIGK